MGAVAAWWGRGSRLLRAGAAVLVGAAAVLGPLAPAMGASPELQLRDDPEAVELGDITDEAKTVVNSTIDDAAGGVERYQFELSSPKSVEVVLRLLTANADVYLESAGGDLLGSGVELGRSDERFSITLAAGTYEVRVESSSPVRYRMKLKLSEPVGEPVGGTSTDSSESPADSRTDPGTETDLGTGTDLVEAWTAVLDVGATDGTVGYSRWANFGSLTSESFDVDGSSYGVILLAGLAGGLYLGLRRSLDTEFVLDIDGHQFVGSESLVPAGLPLRGAYWWPSDGLLTGSVGDALDVSLSAGADALPERGTAPPGAWFSRVPDAHDGSSQFTLRLNFDEDDVGVVSGSLADALTVTGGSLVAVSEVSPVGKTWELAVTPDGASDVTVALAAPADCASAASVCSADGRMLRNSPQANIGGPGATTRLASLTVGSLALSPAFDPEVTLYSATAPAGTQQITVEAGPANSSSVATVSPADADAVATGHQVALAQGAQTVIAVTVVAADGAERTYWAVVDVPGAGPSEQGSEPPKLNGLAVDGVDDLGFDPATTRYETTADPDADTATIITGLHDTDATVQVITLHGDDPTLTPDLDDGDPVEGGHQAPLAADGETLVLVIVTSADGLRQRAYVILISRQASGATPRYSQTPGKQSQVSLEPGRLRSSGIFTRHTNLPTLDSITLADTTLSPAFAAGTTAYTAEVAADVATVTVNATAPAGTTYIVTPADTDDITDGHQVNLAEPGPDGVPTQTVIAVIARNAQNAVNAYIITVSRDSPISAILPAGCELEHLQDQGDGTLTASGRFVPSCTSLFEYPQWISHLPAGITTTGNAHFYELTLPRISDVTIRLDTRQPGHADWWTTSTHTVVRSSDGTQLAHYFDHADYDNDECLAYFDIPCPDHGRLRTRLEAGTYLIEAIQHYSLDGRQRLFRIDVAVSDYVGSSAPLLASLTVDGSSVPSFSSETFLYEMDRPGAQVTVAAEAKAADPAFGVAISPADADTNTAGHQIDVAEHGLTEVTVSVSDDVTGYVHEYKVVLSGDHSADVSSTGAVSVGGSTRARVDFANDRDWFAVDLVAGTAYVIELLGVDSPPGTPASGTLEDPKIWGITLEDGTAVANTSDDSSGTGNNGAVWYRPTASGTYFVIAGAAASGTGIYNLAVSEVVDDFAASTSTTGVVTVGGAAAAGEMEIGDDQDWFEVTLAAGHSYWFMAKGASTGRGTLTDPHLYGVFDSAGTLVADTADADGGVGTDAQVVFEPASAGSYYVAVGTGNSGRGTYELTAGVDDYPAGTATSGTVAVDGGATSAEVDYRGDRDWLAVTLAANTTYWLEVQGAPSKNGTLADPHLYGVMDSVGTMVADTADADNGHGADAELIFEVSTAGTYYIHVGSGEVGTYQVSVADVSAGFTDDFAGDATTAGTVAVGGSVDGQVQYLGDQDWFAVTLEADQEYFVWLDGRGRRRGTLPDPHLYGVMDSTGTLVAGTSDADSGAALDSFLLLTVDTGGTFYIAAGSAGGERGTYRVTVVERPLVSVSEPPGYGTDHPDGARTHAYAALDDTAFGHVPPGDADWYWVYLEEGQRYQLEMWRVTYPWSDWRWDGRVPRMRLRDDDGKPLDGMSADDLADFYGDRRSYTAERTGMHLLEVWSEWRFGDGAYFNYDLDFTEASDE
ncbi:MAG: pre-peptidase C-terminal domain-containing protein [Acidimicrobiaceae bacterium]|nr:pre-peptidase C-terminal domain-containing protein [Acidimicrobiaceae bacterium]